MASYYLHLDESIKGRLIAVGGFVCAAEDLRAVTDSWVAMREQMGIEHDEPLKWNYGQSNATRQRLEAAGWGRRERRRLTIETIRAAPITLLADVIYDDRASRRPPLDFYKEALDWLLLRFRNLVTDAHFAPTGPNVVVLDQPSPSPPARYTENPRFRWLEHRDTIWYRVYLDVYENGWRFPWAGGTVRPLRQDGFYPSVVVSHAKFNPLLEVADTVCGLCTDFVHFNLTEVGQLLPEVDWQDEQFMRVARKFRSNPRNGDILNWGFALFPRTAPMFRPFTQYVTNLCTNDAFASLRGD